MSSTSAGGLGTLGKLPGEIRNRIYQFYFEDAEIAKIDQLWIDSHRMDNKSAGFIGGYKTCKPNKKVPSIWKKFFPRELLLCSKAILAEAKLSSKSTNYNLRLQYHLKGRHKARKAMTLPPEFLCKATTKLILSAISADEFGEEYHRFSLPAHKVPRLTAIHFDSLAHNLRPIEISDPSFPEGVHKDEFDDKLIEGVLLELGRKTGHPVRYPERLPRDFITTISTYCHYFPSRGPTQKLRPRTRSTRSAPGGSSQKLVGFATVLRVLLLTFFAVLHGRLSIRSMEDYRR
jgi:hypothetical protein